MREQSLLIGALTATAIAAAFGVYKTYQRVPSLEIAPVTRLDSARLKLSHRPDGLPIRLTSDDGAGLRLSSLKVNAAIEDPIALTELHLTFENPEPRNLEGRFLITLPQGASVSRFALKMPDGSWQEAEVVERKKARDAYETQIHRDQREAPALFEQAAGNEFSARVFAIPALGQKEIILTYSEVLEAGASYVVPLKGLPNVGALDVNVHASGVRVGGRLADGATKIFGIQQTSFTPAQDFVVDARLLPRSAGLRNGKLVMARVVPFGSSRPDPLASAVVMIDTSASRTLGIVEQANLLRRVFEKLPPDATVSVACFDQEVVPLYSGTVEKFGDDQVAKIIERGALGASDIGGAIAWAGKEAVKTNARRVILVSDGVATAGETDGEKIKLEVEKLRAAKVDRLDAIAMGGNRNDAFLRSIVRGVLDRDGTVLDSDIGGDGLARRLSEVTTSAIPVKVAGSTWSWPRTLDGMQAGDEVIVYAEVAEGTPVQIDVGGQSFSPELRAAERPLLERAWAQAKIQSLIEAPTQSVEETRREILALSTKHRVLSGETAMLVLEKDVDYTQQGIDHTADTDVLTVKDGRVSVVTEEDRKRVKAEDGAKKQGGADNDNENQKEGKDSHGFDIPFFGGKKKASDTSTVAPDAPAPSLPATPTPVVPLVLPTTTPTAIPPPSPSASGRFRADDDAPPATPTQKPVAKSPPKKPKFVPLPPQITTAEKPSKTNKNQERVADEETKRALEALQKAQLDDSGDLGGGGSGGAPRRFETQLKQASVPSVRLKSVVVDRGLTQNEALRVVKAAVPKFRACYTLSLHNDSSASGNLHAHIVVNAKGLVENVTRPEPQASTIPDTDGCSLAVMRSLRFAAPSSEASDLSSVDVELAFTTDDDGGKRSIAENGEAPSTTTTRPYEGRFKTVMDLLARSSKDEALAEATRWHAEEPTNLVAFVALGEAAEAKSDVRLAARAYGSILELFASRAEARRFAGERLERLHDAAALRLAIDTYAKAAAQRPDQPSSHRLYAFALLRQGEYEKAFEALRVAASTQYPSDRFAGVARILHEDLGLVAAAWTHSEPRRATEIRSKLRAAGGQEENEPSLRFVIVWETDTTDLNLHIWDGKNAHVASTDVDLPSGGSLYADIRTGYGPECFTVRGARERRVYPYTARAQYANRGAMGYGMGKLEVIDHDGKGNLVFDERPFVVMSDGAYVDLGAVDAHSMQVAQNTREVKGADEIPQGQHASR